MAKKQNFEESLERLRAIVDKLEEGDLSLEDGVKLYKEGLTLAKSCGKQLDAAKNEVKIVTDGLLSEFKGLEGDGLDEG